MNQSALSNHLGDPNCRPQAGAHVSDGMQVDTHWHAHDMHQLLYAFEGSLDVEDEKTLFVAPRQLALWIPAGVIHRTRIDRVQSGSIFFSPHMMPRSGDRIRMIHVSPLMRQMLMAAMRWPLTTPEQPISAAYFEALALLCGEWIEAETRLMLPTSSDRRVRRAMDYTRKNLATVDAPLVCCAVGLSQRNLSRLFMQTCGISWEEYRRRCRLARALILLGDTALPIGTIATQIGFASQSAFGKNFRAAIGEEPRAYRKRVASAFV
ncbi:MAG TPA: helix-turn-helix domain-containing protein [Spongiibacteraceae bacterium]|jgi:AraC-like DNA-binding protein